MNKIYTVEYNGKLYDIEGGDTPPTEDDLLGLINQSDNTPNTNVSKQSPSKSFLGQMLEPNVMSPMPALNPLINLTNEQYAGAKEKLLGNDFFSNMRSKASDKPGNLLGITLPSQRDVAKKAQGAVVDVLSGLAAEGAASQGTRLATGAAKGFNNIFKSPSDEFVTSQGQGMVNKITEGVKNIRSQYKQILDPFKNNVVSGEKFESAIRSLPKNLREEFIDKFGSGVISDKFGRQSSTVGNLHKMSMAVEDMIKRSPDELSRMGFSSQELSKAKSFIKDLYLSEVPEEASAATRLLDKQFGPVIKQGESLLKKLRSKGDVVNTEYLLRSYRNPDFAGRRTAMKNMSKVGIDLGDEIKSVEKVIKTQKAKKAVGKIASHVTGLGVLGKLLRH